MFGFIGRCNTCVGVAINGVLLDLLAGVNLGIFLGLGRGNCILLIITINHNIVGRGLCSYRISQCKALSKRINKNRFVPLTQHK